MIVESPERPRPELSVATKRVVIAHISLCEGCCCGNTSRGKPPVPVDELKQEWRARELAKFVQLSISGCLGPCDVINVVRISTADEDVWLGNFKTLDDYTHLANWADDCKTAGRVTPLPEHLQIKRFDPFRNGDREIGKDAR